MATALAAGCAESLEVDPAPATAPTAVVVSQGEGGATIAKLDARSDAEWVYVHLQDGAAHEVAPPVPADSQAWDLAFQRFKVITNGGVSGTGGIEVAVVEAGDFEALVEAPAGAYLTDAADSDDEGLDVDSPFLTNGGWYAYDATDHTLSPRAVVYVVHSVEGAYYKLRMLDYYDDAGTSGFPSFEWAPVDAPSGAPQTDPEVLVVDAALDGTWVHVDLAARKVVEVGDPSRSDAWDLAVSRTQLRTNSGTSGAGLGGARLAPEGLSYDAVASSPTTGFVVDAVLSSSPGTPETSVNPAVGAWYDYDATAHRVSPRDVVFLVRGADGSYAKLQVLGYADGELTLRSAPVDRAVVVGTTEVDASASDAWAYLDLRAGEVVSPEDPTASLGWDLALSRTKIRTNGGTSGIGQGGAHDPGAISLDAIGSAPAGQGCYLPAAGHICSCEMTEAACSGENGVWTTQCGCEGAFVVDAMLPVPGPPGSGEYSGNEVLGGWYDYDPTTHVTAPKDKAFVVRTADGGFAKLRVASYADGTYTLEWAYAGAGQAGF